MQTLKLIGTQLSVAENNCLGTLFCPHVKDMNYLGTSLLMQTLFANITFCCRTTVWRQYFLLLTGCFFLPFFFFAGTFFFCFRRRRQSWCWRCSCVLWRMWSPSRTFLPSGAARSCRPWPASCSSSSTFFCRYWMPIARLWPLLYVLHQRKTVPSHHPTHPQPTSALWKTKHFGASKWLFLNRI